MRRRRSFSLGGAGGPGARRAVVVGLAVGVGLALGVGVGLAGCGDDGGETPDDAGPTIDAGPAPVDEIGFVPGDPLPAGQWILANEWAATPNQVFALDPADLSGPARTVFRADRVWSMGAARDGRTIVFSSADPMQEAHFGITIGDAIQNGFVFDTAARSVAMLAPAGSPWANVNDEGFQVSSDGAHVYLVRRYDFTAEGAFLGWRLGRVRTADGGFEFLRPDQPGGPFELRPQEVPGTTRLLFELRARPPATGSSVHTRDLASGAEQEVRADTSRPNLGPDGRRVLFADRTDQSRLKTFDLQAPADPPIPVSPTLGAGASAWSPDGQAIVYTVFDGGLSCDHLERVAWNGAAWSAPTRVRDCAQTGEFITALSWVTLAP
jgi:hypothetical protein